MRRPFSLSPSLYLSLSPSPSLSQGGGGALFREKIVEECAEKFIVIVDDSKMCEMSPRCRREITTSTVPLGMVTRIRFGLTSSSAASSRRLSGVWAVPAAGATGSGRRLRSRWRSRLSAGSTRCAPSPSCLHSRARDRRDRPPRDRRETASHPFAPPGVDRRQAAAAPRLVRKQRRRRKGPRGHRQRPPRASHPPAGCPPSPRPSPDHFPQASTSSTSFSTRRSPTRQRRRDPTTPRLRPTPSPRAARRADGTMPAHKGCGRVHHRPPPPRRRPSSRACAASSSTASSAA